MRRFLLFLCFILSNAIYAQNSSSQAVKLSGGLNAYAGLYQASGIDARNQTTPFGLSGSVNVALPGGVSLPFSMVLGNQGANFRQPFNQFGVSPTYKWAMVHAGYRNVQFSPFTLAGHTFLGGGFEINPGKLRLGAVYGRFNKAISTDLANPDQALPSFKRTGYAVKLGYGTASNYVDLNLLNAADDQNSITPNESIAPARNTVIGLTSRFTLVKRVSFELDAAGSAYTRDTRAQLIPLEQGSLLKAFTVFMPAQLSTQLTTALQTAVGYQNKVFGLKLQYKRIDPNFQTMGAYYFQSDIVSYTVAPSFNLMNSKLRIMGSLGIQKDNLAQNKNAQTGRTVGSAVVSFNPSTAFGLDLQFSNYGISQQAGLRPIIDTLRLAQNNLSLMGNLRYNLQNESVSHLFTLTVTHQQLSDLNQNTAEFTQNQNQNVNLSYFFTQLESGFGANATASYTQTFLPQNQTVRFYGPTVGVNHTLLDKKLNVSASGSYLFNQQLGQNGQVINGSANASYQLGKRQSLSLQLGYLNSNTGQPDQKFNELRGSLGYGISF
ncbi:hypothetical protein FHS57_003391 [Runella defluvii]|uniref:Outer membrane protein beta-barrel domain-containing protein n=1 Tax=Runella defluvii TaxID=370973 RepID=A0A7W6ER77_9BACT|nr:hypothetical protein [Runella defluvii]MBB3839385.1 hypothetical protein [Runella defluvii]